jgi:hypothetical protein
MYCEVFPYLTEGNSFLEITEGGGATLGAFEVASCFEKNFS